MRLLVLAAALCLTACKSCDDESIDPVDPDEATHARYHEAVERLSSSFMENGWVVSREADGTPQHTGDSLIWTGLWLAAAPCTAGIDSARMLQATILDLGGALVRFQPLPEKYVDNQASLDGALGLYRGIAHRITECEEIEPWVEVVHRHKQYLADHGGLVNVDSQGRLVGEFRYLVDLLAWRLGLGDEPDQTSPDRLMATVTGWAALVNATQEAAFRVHLGYQALKTAETLGEGINWYGFCGATSGMGMALVDHQCGRADLKTWIDGFEYNTWEYQLQRAKWEDPDGKGLATPGLDLLVAMKTAYNL